jgi:hypothetical protein
VYGSQIVEVDISSGQSPSIPLDTASRQLSVYMVKILRTTPNSRDKKAGVTGSICFGSLVMVKPVVDILKQIDFWVYRFVQGGLRILCTDFV